MMITGAFSFRRGVESRHGFEARTAVEMEVGQNDLRYFTGPPELLDGLRRILRDHGNTSPTLE